jgi:anti-sigma28 factor (negative regulator of flagellin synthesis)
MSIEKISGSNHNNMKRISDAQTLEKYEGVKGKHVTTKEGSKLKNVDKVEISSEVKKLQKTLSNLKSELKTVPDVREEKVQAVKAAGLRPLGT